jgi:outer membrane protein TolC
MLDVGRLAVLACSLSLCVSLHAQALSSPGVPSLPRTQQLPLEGRSPNAGTPNPGSVSSGAATREALSLTLQDAIQRGLRYNLGPITANDEARAARAQRIAAMAQLLPDLTGGVRETVQQIDLAALGFRLNLPGFSFPTVVGPFNYFDTRAYFNESASLTALHNWRTTRELTHAADLNIKDSREIVTLGVANAYLQLIAQAARVETVRAQITAAQAVYQQALDRNKSGLNARIDVTRSLVELQTQQQRLTSFSNDYAKQKIALARIIGLPLGQPFTLADAIPYRALPLSNLDEMIARALRDRTDIQAAAAQVKAAEIARGAARAEYLPSVDVNADYGALGVNPAQSHGTFLFSAGIRFPILRFGRIRADILEADAVLAHRRAEYQDLRGHAEQEVRDAVLDITTAAQQVGVAESNRKLAAETMEQARDRFRAGVADTVEVVQAQESVASAEQDYISALYLFNLAQVSLARAVGAAGEGVARLLQGR